MYLLCAVAPASLPFQNVSTVTFHSHGILQHASLPSNHAHNMGETLPSLFYRCIPASNLLNSFLRGAPSACATLPPKDQPAGAYGSSSLPVRARCSVRDGVTQDLPLLWDVRLQRPQGARAGRPASPVDPEALQQQHPAQHAHPGYLHEQQVGQVHRCQSPGLDSRN